MGLGRVPSESLKSDLDTGFLFHPGGVPGTRMFIHGLFVRWFFHRPNSLAPSLDSDGEFSRDPLGSLLLQYYVKDIFSWFGELVFIPH